MNELIKPLAKILDISASELERIVSSLNMNAPQIYERLLHEWQWYRVLDTLFKFGLTGLALIAVWIFIFKLDDDTVDAKEAKVTLLTLFVLVLFIASTMILQPILAPHIDMIMQLK